MISLPSTKAGSAQRLAKHSILNGALTWQILKWIGIRISIIVILYISHLLYELSSLSQVWSWQIADWDNRIFDDLRGNRRFGMRFPLWRFRQWKDHYSCRLWRRNYKKVFQCFIMPQQPQQTKLARDETQLTRQMSPESTAAQNGGTKYDIRISHFAH